MRYRREKIVLHLILLLIFISVHMQYPVFTPLAVSLGAGSMVIGLMLSTASFANLGGNLLAGLSIDRTGPKLFIVIPLLMLAISFLAHIFVQETSHLFILRVLNGFILAFLTPACMAFLSSFARNSESQSRNMALNTFMVTLAMAAAPALGGWAGEKYGADGAYLIIAVLTGTAFCLAVLFLEQPPVRVKRNVSKQVIKGNAFNSLFYPVFLTAFAIMFAQSILMYELPFLIVEQGISKGEAGKLTSLLGIGTMLVLAFIFLHRIRSDIRALSGLILMAAALGIMMFSDKMLPYYSILLFGAASGIIFPAMMTLVAEKTRDGSRGMAFAFLSAVFSTGTITGPFIAAAVRDFISPYFTAWFVLMAVVAVQGAYMLKQAHPAPVSRT
ncbi:MFS transporter [Evansella clarkii]|uniref:MFS transporter n=1 Tax=Evansella clarkii TaxID=79879 RepID=UPI000B437670|nr:MFS transporter [Evansella clarkii]